MSEDSSSKPLVLIVDDDEDIRTYLSVLIHDSAETIEAANGDKGIALAESRLPDLILLDLMMPGTDGYQVCKTLKQNADTRHIPVVFITAQADRAFEKAAIKIGAIDYVVKPFDTDIVTAKVKNYLSMLHQGEQLQGVIRQRRGRYLAWAALAVLIAAGLGYVGHGLIDREPAPVASAPTVPPAPAAPKAAPPPQPAAPVRVAPAPPAPVPPQAVAPPPVATQPLPVQPVPQTVPQTAPQTTTAPAADQSIRDARHVRSNDRFGWVKDAHCGVVPLVEWWQNVTPNSIALYVEKHHKGVWDQYAEKWRNHLIRTENTMARGRAIKAPNGRVLKDGELREFVAKLRKRVDVVECLARAAARRTDSGQ